ncbi:hypothetical protein H1R20_g7358, partial [Candolleomyces eurysporus]
MSLPEGLYIIESKENGATIGRNPREDLSLLPKPVVIHPVGEGLLPQASWIIKPEGEGTYLLENLGGFAIKQDKALYADIQQPPTLTKWKLEHQPQHGESVYTITLPESGDGWTVEDTEAWSQIAVLPLAATFSLPPQYFPRGIFSITPLPQLGFGRL